MAPVRRSIVGMPGPGLTRRALLGALTAPPSIQPKAKQWCDFGQSCYSPAGIVTHFRDSRKSSVSRRNLVHAGDWSFQPTGLGSSDPRSLPHLRPPP